MQIRYDKRVSDICIRPAQPSDRNDLVRMRVALWPDSSAEEHDQELTAILEGKPVVTLPLTILVAENNDRMLVGFLEVDLRSHADGWCPARPVGYVGGWYVAAGCGYRRTGNNLLREADDWARGQCGVERAGDTWS